MTTFTILIDKLTGIPTQEYGYTGSNILSEQFVPANAEQIAVSETTPNYELIKAFFFGDPNRLTTEYKLTKQGGIKYDFANKTFTFHKQDISIDINQLRIARNSMLQQTDKYMLVPDLPQDIKTELIAFREALRNATTKVGTEWETVYDINWPLFPEKLTPTAPTPPQV